MAESDLGISPSGSSGGMSVPFAYSSNKQTNCLNSVNSLLDCYRPTSSRVFCLLKEPMVKLLSLASIFRGVCADDDDAPSLDPSLLQWNRIWFPWQPAWSKKAIIYDKTGCGGLEWMYSSYEAMSAHLTESVHFPYTKDFLVLLRCLVEHEEKWMLGSRSIDQKG